MDKILSRVPEALRREVREFTSEVLAYAVSAFLARLGRRVGGGQ